MIRMATLQGINISHLGKRKIIFKMPFLGDMLVPWRVHSVNIAIEQFLLRSLIFSGGYVRFLIDFWEGYEKHAGANMFHKIYGLHSLQFPTCYVNHSFRLTKVCHEINSLKPPSSKLWSINRGPKNAIYWPMSSCANWQPKILQQKEVDTAL